jgi:site-specific DNA-cytosine methylase
VEFAPVSWLIYVLQRNILTTSQVAARTFKRNNSEVQVFIADGCILLDRRIRLCRGEKLEPYLDEDGNIIPDLPIPEEVDMINGGPPCPAYSVANRHKTWDDIRNTLVILFLSYLEFYKPKYFLLENVRGLLSHRVRIS